MATTRKRTYELTNDSNGRVIAITKEYNEDLAIMWAMRTLKNEKESDPKLIHATLWKKGSRYGQTKIQGFRRAN